MSDQRSGQYDMIWAIRAPRCIVPGNVPSRKYTHKDVEQKYGKVVLIIYPIFGMFLLTSHTNKRDTSNRKHSDDEGSVTVQPRIARRAG
jgi:hypothetical protein